MALCVNESFEYIQIKDGETGSQWVLLESRLSELYKDLKKAKFEIVKRIKGADLKGKRYVPLFTYYQDRTTAFVVMADNYVSSGSGTGIVHQAPGFGVDDYRVCLAHGVVLKDELVPCPVDEAGRFTAEVTDFVGQYVKEADKVIIKTLKQAGRLVRQTQISHSYPFCWRSDTPLIYKAVPSWFIRVEEMSDRLLKNNAETSWVPGFVKEKRFANWLGDARDWAVSRSRYWGTPIPLWVSDDMQEVVCIGSIAELEELTGVKNITDIHRDFIDDLTIPSRQGKGVLRRIPEVFDCWFESGSMPYAQSHYPFENKETFHERFPADFIAEGLDQTRGWFYTLLVLSTHLFDTAPFKNLIVNGLVLASDGKKMSKRLKNYPEPTKVIDLYGADALRIYLINSPVVRADTLKFKEDGVREVLKDVFIPWLNSYKFFVAQAILLKKESSVDYLYNPSAPKSDNVMDRWILASCQSLIKFVREEMAAYRLYTVVPQLLNLIGNLTNWYIRFNRKRLKGDSGLEEALSALNTLFDVLYTLARCLAPFTPFITENMYQGLKNFMAPVDGDVRSVHFLPFPTVRSELFDEDIERAVARMQTVIMLGRNIRESKMISLKTPLRELVVIHPDEQYRADLKSLENYIFEELNIRTLTLTAEESKYGVQYKAMPESKILGLKYRAQANKLRMALLALPSDQVKLFMDTQSIVIDGITLTSEELTVKRFVEKGDTKYEPNFDNNVIVLLDTEIDSDMAQEALAREWMNRVQRGRKALKLNPTDDVTVYYRLVQDLNGQLAEMLTGRKDFLEKNLKSKSVQVDGTTEGHLAPEEIEINGSKILLGLVKIQ